MSALVAPKPIRRRSRPPHRPRQALRPRLGRCARRPLLCFPGVGTPSARRERGWRCSRQWALSPTLPTAGLVSGDLAHCPAHEGLDALMRAARQPPDRAAEAGHETPATRVTPRPFAIEVRDTVHSALRRIPGPRAPGCVGACQRRMGEAARKIACRRRPGGLGHCGQAVPSSPKALYRESFRSRGDLRLRGGETLSRQEIGARRWQRGPGVSASPGEPPAAAVSGGSGGR